MCKLQCWAGVDFGEIGVMLAYGKELDVLVRRSRKDDRCESTPCLGPLWPSSAAASQRLSNYCSPQRPLSVYGLVQYYSGWWLVTLSEEISKVQSNSVSCLKLAPHMRPPWASKSRSRRNLIPSIRGVCSLSATHGTAHPSPCSPWGWGSSQFSGHGLPRCLWS